MSFHMDMEFGELIMAAPFMWLAISFILAIAGGALIYFLFLTKENDKHLTGNWKKIYDCLSFEKLYAEGLLKIFYIIAAIYITLVSFIFLIQDFFLFLFVFIVGNVILRLAVEFCLVILLIYRNIIELNKKGDKKEIKKQNKK